MRTAIAPFALALLALALPAPSPAEGPRYDRRWVWVMANLLVDTEVDRVVGLVERAGRDEYNGVVLADTKFNILDRMDRRYAEHVARVTAAADRAKVEIIPAVFPIGYSNPLLANDPNLAEGMPVEGAPFVVRGGEATLVPDPAARLRNGDLEAAKGDLFAGYGHQDGPGKLTFADRQVVHGGKISCRMQDLASGPVARLIQTVPVRPRACYRLSCWAKARDLAPARGFRLMARATSPDGRGLSFFEGGLPPTTDWRRISVVFNSQDQARVTLYAGIWEGKAGTLWLDDLILEELPPVNVLRRDGCPLTVGSEAGKVAYAEGRDFEPVVDPKLGMVPYAGEYDFGHPAPPIRLAAGSRIKDGDRLRVGWYHPVIVHDEQVMCCPSELKLYDLLRDQARRVDALFHPRTFFMQHDEIRVMNWCRACRSRNLTPGQLLADNARRCARIVEEVRPGAKVVAWSDMFDPNHNAVKDYYLVNGTLEGSWEGLDRSAIVANWNAGKARASLDFFAGRGHPQVIAGYYDGDDNLKTWDAAARGVPGVMGFMYTTWQARFDDLERYGRSLIEAK